VDPYEPLLSLGLAVVAGLLVGLEREQSAPVHKANESFLGGARTYPLVALTGALATLLGRHFGAPVVVVAFGSVVVFLVVAYVDTVRRGSDRGLTSEVAFLITFLLGALSVAHDIIPQGGRRVFTVLGAAVAVTALLSAKPVVQPLMRRVSREDVVSVLKFLIVALLLVPWLPDRDFGPLGALNLRTIGWMMLLVAGLSFTPGTANTLFSRDSADPDYFGFQVVLAGEPASLERSFGTTCHGAGRAMSRTGARIRSTPTNRACWPRRSRK